MSETQLATTDAGVADVDDPAESGLDHPDGQADPVVVGDPGDSDLADDLEIDDGGDDRVYFEGDTGTLRLITRKALVLLLKRTHVAGYRHPREYQAIVEDADLIRSRLNDLFLELIIDEANEVAYKRQAGQELGRAFPTLLINRSYTRDEIAVLLRIRDIHHRAKRDGEAAAYVERSDLLESLRYIRPADTKDQVRADALAGRAIERLTEERFLQTTDDPDRLRISPVIETLLTVEQLRAFSDAIAVDDPPGDDHDSPADDPADDPADGPAGEGQDHDDHGADDLGLADPGTGDHDHDDHRVDDQGVDGQGADDHGADGQGADDHGGEDDDHDSEEAR